MDLSQSNEFHSEILIRFGKDMEKQKQKVRYGDIWRFAEGSVPVRKAFG
jgi:hypothetical protein